MAKHGLPAFRQCPGCSYDFLTGEGSRSCGWFDCPYLPEDFKVLCPACNFNYATREGDHRCDDLATCEWAIEGFKHAGQLRRAIQAHTVQ